MIVDVKQFNQERINNCILALPLKRVFQLESKLTNISKYVLCEAYCTVMYYTALYCSVMYCDILHSNVL